MSNEKQVIHGMGALGVICDPSIKKGVAIPWFMMGVTCKDCLDALKIVEEMIGRGLKASQNQ